MSGEQEPIPYKIEVSKDDILDEAWVYVRYGDQMSVNAARQLAAFFVEIVDELAARVARHETKTGPDPSMRSRLDALCEQYAGQQQWLDNGAA